MVNSITWKKPQKNIFWVVAPYDPYTRRDSLTGRKIDVVHPGTGKKYNCSVIDWKEPFSLDLFPASLLRDFSDSIDKRVHEIFIKKLLNKPEFQEIINEFEKQAKAILLQLILIK
ncbi:hypothetical protein N9164_16465 [Draconibacterium sp.]|nr:hypothetical protein [Draconibacterium sp.]